MGKINIVESEIMGTTPSEIRLVTQMLKKQKWYNPDSDYTITFYDDESRVYAVVTQNDIPVAKYTLWERLSQNPDVIINDRKNTGSNPVWGVVEIFHNDINAVEYFEIYGKKLVQTITDLCKVNIRNYKKLRLDFYRENCFLNDKVLIHALFISTFNGVKSETFDYQDLVTQIYNLYAKIISLKGEVELKMLVGNTLIITNTDGGK